MPTKTHAQEMKCANKNDITNSFVSSNCTDHIIICMIDLKAKAQTMSYDSKNLVARGEKNVFKVVNNRLCLEQLAQLQKSYHLQDQHW